MQKDTTLTVSRSSGNSYNCLPASCEDFVANCTKCDCISFPIDPDICSKTPSQGSLPCFHSKYLFTIKCNKCMYGSFLDAAGNCLMCGNYINNCNSCMQLQDKTIICNACNYGYARSWLDKSACINCRIQTPNCLACMPSKVYAEYVCSECIDNYVVDSTGGCTPCESIFPNCGECKMKSSKPRCSKCSFGYGLIDESVATLGIDTCQLCHEVVPNCVVCTFETETEVTCLACNEGTQMIAKNVCSNCTKIDPYCTMCTADPNPTCVACKSDMAFIDGACRSCMSISGGCRSCVHSPKPYCTECILGFYLTDLGTGATCVLCATVVKECAECTLSDGAVVCVTCKEGYYLTGDGKCVKLQQNLEGCKQYHGNSCSACVEGYVLVNHICIFCRAHLIGCAKCTTLKDSDVQCTECILGYYLKNGKCFACSNAVPNCRTCAPAFGILTTHEVTCTSCAITYYLNTSYNTCELLIPHCAYFFKEESSVQCQMCLEGYHLVIDSQGNSACIYITSERTEAWLHIWVTIILFFGFIVSIFLPICFKSFLIVKKYSHPSDTCDSAPEDKQHE